MKRQVKVISGNYYPQKCGLSHYVEHLNSRLKNSYDITVLLKADSARCWDVGAILNLAVYLRKEMNNIDLLHIHHSAASYEFNRAIFFLPLVARMMGFDKPIVTTVHEYGNGEAQPPVPAGILEPVMKFGQHHGMWDREDGFLLTQSDAIVCTNVETEKLLHERLGSKKPVYRIPISSSVDIVDISKYEARQMLYEQLPIPSGATIFVHFGLLHPLKGLETLIVAFSKVVRHMPDAYLLLLGSDESVAFYGEKARIYREKLMSFIASLRLEDRVFMTGYLPDGITSVYLQAADIGVLPNMNGVSLKNSSLLTLLFHRLPVIATCAFLSQRVLEEANVLSMVPVGNAEKLAAEMIGLSADKAKQEIYRQSARQLEPGFNWESITRQYEGLFNRLTNSFYAKNSFANRVPRFQTVLPEKR